ncbi:uncharacterized protein LOC110705311 [Chenopodium quinoa]|uniref:uncharacterized protein LOC110705311 n=1 Tax=Chenopodium quinoa TaxID=63459 RepID=UPI000B78EC1A|nr:uncharacterized protein LOC110705311 [Chenopodium quinoa]
MEYGEKQAPNSATSSRKRCLPKATVLHPFSPIMYFKPFTPKPSPKLDFNKITYYTNQKDLNEGKKIDDAVIRKELAMNDVQRYANSTVMRMMMLPGGEQKPAYLPLLSDIHGYFQHQGVEVFVEWMFKHHSFEKGEVVPKDVVPIFDLVPTLDEESTITYALPLREKHVFIGAKTNALHVMKIEAQMPAIQLIVLSGVTKKNGIHYHRLTVCGDLPAHPKQPVFEEGSVVLYWNAKDVLRLSFVDNFRTLYDAYNPVLVIIIEARPRHLQVWELILKLPGAYQYETTGHATVGGIVLLWNKFATPFFRPRRSCLTGDVLNVEIVSGPATDPNLWCNTVSDSEGRPEDESDDDYDYIGAWLVNSGLDDDPSIHDEGWC